MEVEVKIRLKSKQDHDKLYQTLGPKASVVHYQKNTFFDGVNGPLEKTKSVMRIRSINNGEKFVLTLKGQAVLENGISRVAETEEELEPSIAKLILDDPNQIPKISTKCSRNDDLLRKINHDFPSDKWKVVGGFENVRKKFAWEGYVVELDETKYEFGTGYEIELETPEPEVAKRKLETFLKEHGIAFCDSTRNKFTNMIKKSIQ